MPTKSDIKHIWWDLVGTIYNTPSKLEELKCQRRFELYSDIAGKPVSEKLKDEYSALYKHHGSHSAVFVSLGKDKGFWQREHNKINILSYLKPDPKTSSMFRTFKNLPYKHCLFTNCTSDYIKQVLNHLDIDMSLFTHVLTNEDIVRPKPDLAGFNQMISISKLAPEQILYVGDRIETDILPAKTVGMQTALVWSNAKSSEADYTFPHVGDVLSLFT